MRVRVYLNRIKTDYQKDFQRAKEYFARHGLSVSFDFVQSNYQDLSFNILQTPQGERVLLKPYMQQVVSIDTSYDMTIFAFNQEEFIPPNIPGGQCYCPFKQPFIDHGTHRNNPPDYHYLEIIHEMMHGIKYLLKNKGIFINDVMDDYVGNATPDDPNSNFSRMWMQIKPHLKLLQPEPQYKYFSSQEVAKYKLVPELWAILDKMRGLANTPFIITSGFRTPQENLNVGGKPNSAHLKGLAVDILCTDNIKRAKMLYGVYNCGTPVFLEIARKHLHIDLDYKIHELGQAYLELGDD